MPAVLTHKAIMLMARERIAEIIRTVDQATTRKRAAGQPVFDLEDKLLALAREAYKQMSTAPPIEATVPGQLFAHPLTDRVSKFAVMGAMGPDITGFSALLAPGQVWVFDTVHKGTPDANREALMAGTCDLAMEIWAEADARITNPADRDKMRAYVLGHLCHVAGDVISHPFINDIEWHLGTETRNKFEHADGEGSLDAMVARSVFARSSTRSGEDWDKWWPTVDEVPRVFHDIYEEALERVYEARTQRPRSFRAYEKVLEELDPPSLDPDFVRDGYSVYRGGIISMGYGYGAFRWFFELGWFFAPAIFTPLLIHALPRGQQLFVEPATPADADREREKFEFMSLPLYCGGLAALYYGIRIVSLTTRGVKGRTVTGLISSIAIALGAIVFIAELVKRGMSPELRWLLMFALPLAIALTFFILALPDLAGHGKTMRGAATLISSLPLIQFIVMWIGLFFVFQVGSADLDLDLGEPVFWILFAFWFVLWGALWIYLSIKARDGKIPESPDSFAARRRHAVRLFDDASVFRDPVRRALGKRDRFFPSGRREIMKLWWTGAGEMSVRSDRYGLVFKLVDGATTEQVVPAPVAPMTPKEYIGYLADVVTDRGGAAGKLKGAMIANEEEENYELPAGATFAAHGDTEKSEAARRQQSATFQKLGSDQDSGYTLFHAPKPMRAIRFTPGGPLPHPFDFAEHDLDTSEASDGYLYPHDQLDGSASDTVMSYAADVGALLCLGAAGHMAAPVAGRDLTKCYQVFRNWNLDRRRVNEWKMLVAGGALSEKGGQPSSYDDAMLHGRIAPADPAAWAAPISTAPGSEAAAIEGEATSRDQGWVQLLRRWIELERQPDQDLMSANFLFPDWPSNRALSRGLAFLLDMPEPH